MSRPLPSLVALALGLTLLELCAAWVGPYELFHDETYYWVGAKRLELGYVDHPPLAAWLLAAATAVLGDGRLVFALIPAACGAATVLVTGLMARNLGAGRFGQLLAGLGVATAPVMLVFFSFYSVNAFEVLFWTAACHAVVELIRTRDERWWLVLGAVAGVALLNKHTFALLGFALSVGILATPLRTHVRSRWLWLGVLAAVLLAFPNVYWNLANGWPSWAFYRSRDTVGNIPTSVGQALILQIAAIGPANVLVWAPGLLFLLFSRSGRRFRALGVAFLVLFIIMLFSGQRRADRIAGIYPVVLAAGAVYWDQRRGRWQTAARWVIVALVLAMGAAVVPATLPLMAPQRVAGYFRMLGEKPNIEPIDVGQDLPLHFLGRLEWQRYANQVIAAWETLPAAERNRSVILAPHWVFASVIEYYGRQRALPPVVAPHNAYYFWRQDAVGRDIVVSTAIGSEALARHFATTRVLDVFRCQYCVSLRSDMPISVSYGPSRPLEELLAEWRHFGLDPAPALNKMPADNGARRERDPAE